MKTEIPTRGGPARRPERRRKPEAVREAALKAGRKLLTEQGPSAVTLKAVAAELGMSHPNLIHHFGSADGFRIELKRFMVADLTRTVTGLVRRQGETRAGVAQIVDTVFSAYGPGGIGTMIAWSALARNDGSGEAVIEAVAELVEVLVPLVEGPDAASNARALVRLVTLLAFADSLIGDVLAEAVGGTASETRELAVRLATDPSWLKAGPATPQDVGKP